jgi:hypothetical protein
MSDFLFGIVCGAVMVGFGVTVPAVALLRRDLAGARETIQGLLPIEGPHTANISQHPRQEKS